jgi:DNA-binding beta-propeller fold protein YncE
VQILKTPLLRIIAPLLMIGAGASSQTISPTVLVSGLQSPYKVILTPRGNLLVSEGGTENNGARISVVSRGGNRTTLLAGLPSGKNVESSLFIGPAGLALQDRTLYMTIADGDADAHGEAPGTTIPNPKGVASPLLSSILAVRFSADVDMIAAPFTLKASDHQVIADGNPVTLDNGNGARAEISLVANFQDFTPNPVTIYKHSDPYSIAIGPNGRDLYIADAGQDSIVRISGESGQMRTLLRIPPIPSSVPGPPVSDPVPNSIVPYGSQFLVAQLTGFPFTPGVSRVSLFDPETGALSPFLNGLTSAMDIVYIPRENARARFLVLEFSNNFLGTPPGPGRLLLFDTPAGTPLIEGLPSPTSMVYDPSTQEVFITDLTGRLVKATLP